MQNIATTEIAKAVELYETAEALSAVRYGNDTARELYLSYFIKGMDEMNAVADRLGVPYVDVLAAVREVSRV